MTWQPFTFTAYSNPSVAAGRIGASVGTTTVQMPSEPLNFQQRKYTGHFLWQRSPFSPATPNHGNPKLEKGGLDDDLKAEIKVALEAFKEEFQATHAVAQ